MLLDALDPELKCPDPLPKPKLEPPKGELDPATLLGATCPTPKLKGPAPLGRAELELPAPLTDPALEGNPEGNAPKGIPACPLKKAGPTPAKLPAFG